MPAGCELATLVEERLLERNRLCEAFFAREAPRLAEACRVAREQDATVAIPGHLARCVIEGVEPQRFAMADVLTGHPPPDVDECRARGMTFAGVTPP